jgi:hypothetical protein
MIKQGEVAFLKTTGEAVFVLDLPQAGEVTVRRPNPSQNGLFHMVEKFTCAELQTLDEQRAQFAAENSKLMEKYGPKVEGLPSVDSNNGFSSN